MNSSLVTYGSKVKFVFILVVLDVSVTGTVVMEMEILMDVFLQEVFLHDR